MKSQKILFVVSFLLLLSSYASADIAVFQYDTTNGTDAYVYEGTGAGFDNADMIQGRSAAGNQKYNAFINWNHTFPSIPASATIDAVNMTICLTELTGGGEQPQVYPILGGWNQTTVDWANQPALNETAEVDLFDITLTVACHNVSLSPTWYEEHRKGNNNGLGFKSRNVADKRLIFDPSNEVGQEPILYVHFTPASPGGTPADPVFDAPTPADNDNDRINITINASHNGSDVRFNLFISNAGSSTFVHVLQNVTSNASNYSSYVTTFSTDGERTYSYNVQNTSSGLFSSNISRNYTLDTINPTITLNGGNNFSTQNTTIVTPHIDPLLGINVSFFDENLFQAMVNATHENGTSVFLYLNTSIGTNKTANVSTQLNFTNFLPGNYTIRLVATDSHTAKRIDDYSMKYESSKTISYDTAEGNSINITSLTAPGSMSSVKNTDRYNFNFEYSKTQTFFSYLIEADKEIHYIEGSKHNAHFVVLNKDGTGNWIDFDLPSSTPGDYIVHKLSDKSYQVVVRSKGADRFTFNSLGGLNTQEEHYKIQVAAFVDLRVTDILNPTTHPTFNASYAGPPVQALTERTNVFPANFTNITAGNPGFRLNATGFAATTFNPAISAQYHNFTVNMTQVEAILINIFDEESIQLIGAETFTILLSSNNFSQTFTSITNNPTSIAGLAPNNYTLKLFSANYAQREYFDLTVTDVGTTTLNAYLINSSLGDPVTFTVKDASADPIAGARTDFYRVLNDTTTLVGQEDSDFAGNFVLDLYGAREYIINTTKIGFAVKQFTLEPTASTYDIFLLAPTSNISQSEGISYGFSPTAQTIQNNTRYNFTFSLNSSVWNVTDCRMYIRHNETQFSSSTTSFGDDWCNITIEAGTGLNTTLNSYVVYVINSTVNRTLIHEYAVISTYTGQFSLQTVINDIKAFAGAGFNDFTRMMVALVFIIGILIFAASFQQLREPEALLMLLVGLVFFFSRVGFMTLNYEAIPDFAGLRQYVIFYLTLLAAGGYMLRTYTQ
jgi:hypothetical protein|tara:strand:+ start:17893 stop:20925 length:3033 start_codon:yes stop_codon:yes gene_type:complete